MEGQACADLGARTPIGASGIFHFACICDRGGNCANLRDWEESRKTTTPAPRTYSPSDFLASQDGSISCWDVSDYPKWSKEELLFKMQLVGSYPKMLMTVELILIIGGSSLFLDVITSLFLDFAPTGVQAVRILEGIHYSLLQHLQVMLYLC